MTRSTNVIRYTKNPRNSKLSEKQLISRCQHQKWQRHQKHPTQDFLDKLGNEWQHRKFWHRKSRYKEEPNGCFRPQIQKLPLGSISHEPQGSGGVSNMKIKHSLNRFAVTVLWQTRPQQLREKGTVQEDQGHQEDGVALLGRHWEGFGRA